MDTQPDEDNSIGYSFALRRVCAWNSPAADDSDLVVFVRKGHPSSRVASVLELIASKIRRLPDPNQTHPSKGTKQ